MNNVTFNDEELKYLHFSLDIAIDVLKGTIGDYIDNDDMEMLESLKHKTEEFLF